MLAIAWKEFLSLFKSIKSIFIVLILISVSLGVAKIFSVFGDDLTNSLGIKETPFSAGLLLTVLIASPLFVFTLSHNIINEELKNRTVRFLATKTSRFNILVGKFIGSLLFWTACLLLTTLLLIWYSHQFYILEFLQCVIFVSYYLALSTLLSTFINSTLLTNFLGITLSLVMTVLGLWSLNSKNLLLIIYSYITPYHYYFSDNKIISFTVVIFTIIFLTISIYFFRRKDL